MLEYVRKLYLQRFSDDGGDGGADVPDNGGDSDDDDDGDADQGPQQPFAVFPDKKSFMSRVKREARKLASQEREKWLKEIGVENPDDLKSILESFKKQKEQEKSELEKLREQVQKAESEKKSILEQAQNRLKMAEAKLVAQELGVKPERINRFLKLVDLGEVEVDAKGEVDIEALREAIQEVLEEVPEFKVQPQTQDADVDGKPKAKRKGGGDAFDQDASGARKPPLTLELIKKMTPEQVAERIDEIREFMKHHSRK